MYEELAKEFQEVVEDLDKDIALMRRIARSFRGAPVSREALKTIDNLIEEREEWCLKVKRYLNIGRKLKESAEKLEGEESQSFPQG